MKSFTLPAWRAFFFYGALTSLLFGRSISYEFVYDDHWRIYRNPAVQRLLPVTDYFSNPETQAGRSMDGHTYRPLPTLMNAVTHTAAGMDPAWYRLENFFLHSLNATLIYAIATSLLGMATAPALMAGTLFLVHPLQLETVVWVSELSNALALTWMLLALLAWWRFRNTGRMLWAHFTIVITILCFFTRENSVCIAPLLLCMEVLRNPNERATQRARWIWIALIFALSFGYIAGRAHILDRAAQGPLWGNGIGAHIGNVLQLWPLYWQRLLFPDDLRIIYKSIPILSSLWHWRAITGLIGFLCYIALTLLAWAKNRRCFFVLSAFLILWVPGSNIVPLNTLFAERLMYPMLAAVGWGIGLLLEHVKTRRLWLTVVLVAGFFAAITAHQIPVWRNEETLWANAVNIEPKSWFAWGCLGNANELIAEHQLDAAQTDYFKQRALACYTRALENNPPTESRPMITERIDALKR